MTAVSRASSKFQHSKLVWNAIQQELAYLVDEEPQDQRISDPSQHPRVVKFFAPLRVAALANGTNMADLGFPFPADIYNAWIDDQDPSSNDKAWSYAPSFDVRTRWHKVFRNSYPKTMDAFRAAKTWASRQQLPQGAKRVRYISERTFQEKLRAVIVYLDSFARLRNDYVRDMEHLLKRAMAAFYTDCKGYVARIPMAQETWTVRAIQAWYVMSAPEYKKNGYRLPSVNRFNRYVFKPSHENEILLFLRTMLRTHGVRHPSIQEDDGHPFRDYISVVVDWLDGGAPKKIAKALDWIRSYEVSPLLKATDWTDRRRQLQLFRWWVLSTQQVDYKFQYYSDVRTSFGRKVLSTLQRVQERAKNRKALYDLLTSLVRGPLAPDFVSAQDLPVVRRFIRLKDRVSLEGALRVVAVRIHFLNRCHAIGHTFMDKLHFRIRRRHLLRLFARLRISRFVVRHLFRPRDGAPLRIHTIRGRIAAVRFLARWLRRYLPRRRMTAWSRPRTTLAQRTAVFKGLICRTEREMFGIDEDATPPRLTDTRFPLPLRLPLRRSPMSADAIKLTRELGETLHSARSNLLLSFCKVDPNRVSKIARRKGVPDFPRYKQTNTPYPQFTYDELYDNKCKADDKLVDDDRSDFLALRQSLISVPKLHLGSPDAIPPPNMASLMMLTCSAVIKTVNYLAGFHPALKDLLTENSLSEEPPPCDNDMCMSSTHAISVAQGIGILPLLPWTENPRAASTSMKTWIDPALRDKPLGWYFSAFRCIARDIPNASLVSHTIDQMFSWKDHLQSSSELQEAELKNVRLTRGIVQHYITNQRELAPLETREGAPRFISLRRVPRSTLPIDDVAVPPEKADYFGYSKHRGRKLADACPGQRGSWGNPFLPPLGLNTTELQRTHQLHDEHVIRGDGYKPGCIDYYLPGSNPGPATASRTGSGDANWYQGVRANRALGVYTSKRRMSSPPHNEPTPKHPRASV